MTVLMLKDNGKKIHSWVDFKTKWNRSDLNFFNYIGELICEKYFMKMKDSVFYPTWEMVKPPK